MVDELEDDHERRERGRDEQGLRKGDRQLHGVGDEHQDGAREHHERADHGQLAERVGIPRAGACRDVAERPEAHRDRVPVEEQRPDQRGDRAGDYDPLSARHLRPVHSHTPWRKTERNLPVFAAPAANPLKPYSEMSSAERSEIRSPSDSTETRSSTAWAPEPVGPRPSITGVPTAAAKLPSDPPGEAFSESGIPRSAAILIVRAPSAAPSSDWVIGGRVTAPLTSIAEPSSRGTSP